MAVYGRSYRRYSGVLTPAWSRFLIFPRYAYETVFQSKLFVAFFALCFLVPFAGLLIIYLHHNMSALSFLNLPAEELKQFLPIDKKFFMMGTWFQGGLSFLLVLLIGPALVSPDLRNNGLALYLSRPFSRSEYVLGKMSVLLILMSAITWIPGMLLYFFQAYLEGAGWLGSHLRLGFAIFVGSWAWILFLSILTLAVSAWVKWRPVARIQDDGRSLLVRTRSADRFYMMLNQVVLETDLGIETVMPTDADVNAVYQYLIGEKS